MATRTNKKTKTPSSAARKRRTAPRRSTSAQDAFAVLQKDHREVEALFARFDKMKGDGANKEKLARKICDELEAHTTVEEELFYTRLREELDIADLLDEAQVEHDSAKSLIAQVRGMSVGDDLYDAKVKVLGEYVKHHVQEEEKEMFPKARKADLDFDEIGQQMRARKAEILVQGAERGGLLSSMLGGKSSR